MTTPWEAEFGDDGDDLSGLTDAASSASDAVTGAAQDATTAVQGGVSAIQGAVSNLAQGVQGLTQGASGSAISAAMTALQSAAPAVSAAAGIANTAAKLTGNKTLGQVASLGAGLPASAQKALSHVTLSGPDATIVQGAAASVAQAAASANIPAIANVWDQIESDAVNTGKEVVKDVLAVEAVVGVATVVMSTLGFTALAAILSTLITQIITILTLGIVTATATGAALGAEAGAIGVVIGAVVGAVVGVANYLTGGPKLQITNGLTFSVEDYVKRNLQNAANWVKNAQPGDFIGLTPKTFADTFELFLANPIWLFENQSQTGLSQPFPPDFNSGSPLDLAYRNVPGAFEMLNQVQLVLATSLIHSSPGRLPFFMSVQHPKGAVANKVGQDPSKYKPIPPPLAPANAPKDAFGIPVSSGSHTEVFFAMTPGAKRTAYAWAPGTADGSGGTIYTGCLNMLTNESVITPKPKGIADAGAKITDQTAIADGAFMIQVMLPALTTDQCHQLFTSAKPAYDATIARVDAWLKTQKTEPKPADFKQFNITTPDVAAAIELWQQANPPKPTAPVKRIPVSHTVGAHLAAKAAAAKAIAAAARSHTSSQPHVVNGGASAKKFTLPQKVALGGGAALGLAGLGMLVLKKPHGTPKF